jgi:hypothetical protein
METGWCGGAPSAKNFVLKYSGQVGDRVRSVRGLSHSRSWHARPIARRRQQRMKDGGGADGENAVSEYCRYFCSG